MSRNHIHESSPNKCGVLVVVSCYNLSKFFAFSLPVSLIAFSEIINNKPGPFLSFLFVRLFLFTLYTGTNVTFKRVCH